METTYYTHLEKTIIDSIDLSVYGYENDRYLYDKIKTLFNIFKSEYVHANNSHLSSEVLFAEWLQGSPSVLSVPFYYEDIINNALKAGVKIDNEMQFCTDYWINLSKAFFTLKDNL